MLSQKQLDRRKEILKRADAMLKVKQVYSQNWPAYERIFKMVEEPRTGKDIWRATLPDTWSFATIKTIQSAFTDSKVVPTIIRHQDDPSSKAEDLRDLYTDIAEKGNLDIELYFARLDAFKLGNGFLKTIYNKETRTVWEIKKFDPKIETFEWKKKKINEFDDPKTFRVSPYLILVDDLARLGNFRDLIELEVMGRDEAESKYGHLVKNFKEIPKTTNLLQQVIAQTQNTVAETDGTGLRGTEFESLNQYHFFAPGFAWSDDVVEIIHYWNKGIKTPSGANDSYEILLNGYPVKVDIVGTPSPNPYIHKQIPFTHIPYSPYSKDEFWTAGIIEIGKSDARAIKKHREKMDDRQSLSIFSPAFSDVNDEIDQKDLKVGPLDIILTKGGVPKQYVIPGLSNADLALVTNLEQSYKRATGIDERMLGLESSGPRLTATEVSFLREAAMKRSKDFLFLYKNNLLHSEIKLKFSLFKQYFSNPFSQEEKIKNDKGVRSFKGKFKEFNVRIENVYYKKEISPNFFEGDVDVDLDLQLLMPMTETQMITLWSQVLRDATPFVQAGIVDISLTKVFERYLEALGTNINDLKENKQSESIKTAEAEHKLFSNKNSSASMEDSLPNGTPLSLLSEEHILKHNELLDADMQIEDAERLRLAEHIKKDVGNLRNKPVLAMPPLNIADIQRVGGLPGTSSPSPLLPAVSPSSAMPAIMPQ